MPAENPNFKETKFDSQKNNPDIKEGAEPTDVQFFNVMPKNQPGGEIIDPKIVSMDNETEKVATTKLFTSILKEYKLYLILGVVLVIIAPLGYFLISKLGSKGYETEDLLAKHTGSLNPAKIDKVSEYTTPKEWRNKYFPNCSEISLCGDSADSDHDGQTNLQEFKGNTDPNNPDSDQDGLSDGDEVNVFGSAALESHTAKNTKFSDLDYAKGGYSLKDNKKMDSVGIKEIGAKMSSFGLHQPTLTSLGNILNSLYNFSAQGSASSTTATSTPLQAPTPTPTSFDQSLSAKQDRDTKRSNTIKNIEVALVKYQADNKKYPNSDDFNQMFTIVKPYLKVATNPKDPLEFDPYIYSYKPSQDWIDFTLTFYSEVASGPISKHAADAQKDASSQDAETYDNQRKTDLEDLRTALLLYSSANIAGNQNYVFPALDKYKTALVPDYISAIPKDPLTQKNYEYQPSATFDAFTLKAALQNPPAGNTGYICNQEDDCKFY